MASVKRSLKSIKQKIEAGEPEAAVYEATELLKSIEPSSPDAVSALCFRGLALTQTGRKDEAEKCYLQAFKLQPDHPLPGQALRKQYEKEQQFDKLGNFLEKAVQYAYDKGDAERCAAALQDLLTTRSQSGPQEPLYRALYLLLPSSPLVPLLQTMAPPQGSYSPFPSPIYPPRSFAVAPTLPSTLPHALHLLSSLPLLLNLLIRAQSLVHNEVEAQVKAGRQRLGAGTEAEVRQKTEGSVLSGDLGMMMVDLLREVAGHPGADDEIRRNVEVQEFTFWRKLVGSLKPEAPKKALPKGLPAKPSMISGGSMISSGPPKSKQPPREQLADIPPLFRPRSFTKPTREEALSRTDGLAKGFVLLDVASAGAEEAWSWILEGKDEPTIFYDHELLHKFAKAFPLSPLTDFIDDYCRWFKLPLPEPEETAEDAAPAKASEDKEPAKHKKRPYKKNKAGLNAKERRKARRLAGKEGSLQEDVDQEERDELVGSMSKLVDKLSGSIWVHRVMARISIDEEDWPNAVLFAEAGRKLLNALEAERGIKLPSIHASLDTALGVALVPYFPPKHHARADRLLSGVVDKDPSQSEARFSLGQIRETAGDWSAAREHFEHILGLGGDEKEVVAAREEVGWCLVNEGKPVDGREILEEVVQIRDTRWEQSGKEDEALPRARAWWRLGRTEWIIGDEESKAQAQEWFMASIRALPSFAPAYSALGICYAEATEPDTERALKCFQKAFELDATEADAARKLAEGYADEDEWALVRGIANRVMEGEGGVEGVAGGEVLNAKGRFAPKNGWAWKALGSTEMHYKQYAKAAQAYQIALRADPDDVSIWIQLGEAYIRSGRHTAGLKTLQHALELDPENWVSMYDIGEIYLQLGSYDLAVETFRQVLEMAGKGQVGIMAKLADTMLAQGRNYLAGGFRDRARSAFYGAIALAGDVLRLGIGHRPWAWKVVGDATFELAAQEVTVDDAGQSSEVIHPILQLLVDDDGDRRSAVDGLGHSANLLQSPVESNTTLRACVFAFAYRAYLLKNETRVADPALYDLASALHALAGRLEGEEKIAATKAAIGAIRGALERDAGDERLWNALGVICSDGGQEVAQHAFVVSLELYAKDPDVWVNLGYLYLKLEDVELAGQCFLKAQTLDPDCAKAWLGQGMIADGNGDKDHARALYGHAVTLSAGALLEADLAQAVSAFLPLVNSAADPSILQGPAFALRHYTQLKPRDAAAIHLYALICERLGLADEAAASLDQAVKLLEEEFETTESTEVERAYCVALANLGRVRLAAGRYSDSLEAFTSVWELVGSLDDLDDTTLRLKIQSRLGQALAQFWLGDAEQSLEGFQAALDQAGGGAVKNDIAVLLARTLWGLGDEQAKETAKTHLMECLSQDSPPVKVVNTLAAVALISSDSDLADAAIGELRSIPPERVAVEDLESLVPLVLSSQSIIDSKPDQAIQSLETALNLVPADIKTRNRLAKLMIATQRPEDAVALLSFELGSAVGPAVKSEMTRIRGLARIVSGDEAGMSDLLCAVKMAPWDEKAWEGVAWARKVLDELDGA